MNNSQFTGYNTFGVISCPTLVLTHRNAAYNDSLSNLQNYFYIKMATVTIAYGCQTSFFATDRKYGLTFSIIIEIKW